MLIRPPTVVLEQVSKRFENGRQVLKSIDLEVRPGEIVAFLGPSGVGKSTLLRLLSGLDMPTRGSIRFYDNGSEYEEDPSIAYIFQDPNLLPWRNVRRNIELPLLLKGVDRRKRRQRAHELASMVGLADSMRLFPHQLSGGMRMRVSLARGLTLSPRILLLDEPFGSLDAITRNRLNEDLLALHRKELWTAFFVTHSVAEAVFLSHRVHILAGTPASVVETISVPLAFPRSAETRSLLEYQNIVAHASGRLHRIIA